MTNDLPCCTFPTWGLFLSKYFSQKIFFKLHDQVSWNEASNIAIISELIVNLNSLWIDKK